MSGLPVPTNTFDAGSGQKEPDPDFWILNCSFIFIKKLPISCIAKTPINFCHILNIILEKVTEIFTDIVTNDSLILFLILKGEIYKLCLKFTYSQKVELLMN